MAALAADRAGWPGDPSSIRAGWQEPSPAAGQLASAADSAGARGGSGGRLMAGGLLLAIDTSTSQAGVALYDGAVRFEATWEAGRSHSQQAMPMIQRGMELTGRMASEIAAVAAARGPGSFTGVRVGLTLARSLGFALSVPALGVCSLDVLAEGQEPSELPVRPLLDIGRGRFATAEYL